MSRVCVIMLLAAVGACTRYQPVTWDGIGNWAEARAAASRLASGAVAAPWAPRRAAPAAPGQYRVQPGETLSAIAARHGVSLGTLARKNGIRAPFALRAGQVLRIPATTPPGEASSPTALPPAVVAVAERMPDGAPAAAAPALSGAAVEATRRAAARTPPALSGSGFLWPAKGALASGFGEKPNGARNNGINIAAAEGTAVVAAENGIVVYAGSGIAGYGNMLLISHADTFTTTYAHNRDLRVEVGDVVSRGQQVATVGATGGLAAPQLHFEIRQGKKPLDPMSHLAGARTRVASTR